MVRRKVKLEEISEIQEFNRICFQFDCDMDLVSETEQSTGLAGEWDPADLFRI